MCQINDGKGMITKEEVLKLIQQGKTEELISL